MSNRASITLLVMHVRAYRETSVMVRAFSREQGRLTTVVKGAKSQRRRQRLEPLLVGKATITGRTTLQNMHGFELVEDLVPPARSLSIAFYMLELISRALGEHQPEPRIFDASLQMLRALPDSPSSSALLRRYESVLLRELGFAVDYDTEADTGAPVSEDACYSYIAERGFVRCPQNQVDAVPGAWLAPLSQGQYQNVQMLRSARLINQQALEPLIGPEPLRSRSLISMPSAHERSGS